MTLHVHRQHPLSSQDAAVARTSGALLSQYGRQRRSLTLHLQESKEDRPIELPAGAVALLVDILETMAQGRGVTLIPEDAELTTFEAADLLNVSRPYLIKLLDEGAMVYRRIGKHRRIRLEDVMAYKERDDRERDSVMDQLVHEAQQQDMGYERT
jgi:excisionase family DNA binding protein